MPFTVERKVGRLVEGTIGATMTLEEAQAFRTRMWLAIGAVQGRVALYGDVSEATTFEPAVEQRIVEMLRLDNPKVERSAIVFGRSTSAFARQAAQMIAAANEGATQAGRPVDRRGFADKHEAARWLGEVLDEDERARLRALVGDP